MIYSIANINTYTCHDSKAIPNIDTTTNINVGNINEAVPNGENIVDDIVDNANASEDILIISVANVEMENTPNIYWRCRP